MRSENGYILFDKKEDGALSSHFSMKEVRCRCNFNTCIEQKIAQELLDKLEQVRMTYGKPINITSGYRCPEYQKALAAGGKETATGISQHELGRAVDLSAKDLSKLNADLDIVFDAIGQANSFTHVDLRNDRKRRWSYVKE